MTDIPAKKAPAKKAAAPAAAQTPKDAGLETPDPPEGFDENEIQVVSTGLHAGEDEAVQLEVDNQARLAAARKEKAASLPQRTEGVGSGNELAAYTGKEGSGIHKVSDLSKLVDGDGNAKVEVYELRPVPGSKRTVPHLLFPVGLPVPKTAIDLHTRSMQTSAEVKDPDQGETKD